MKKIGLVGGMTPESTTAYYQMLIDLGRESWDDPLHNPIVLIYSIDLAEIVAHQKVGNEDLAVGKVTPVLRETYLDICRRQIEGNEVDAVILACTEIPLVLTADDLPVPVIDTSRCHAEALFEWARS